MQQLNRTIDVQFDYTDVKDRVVASAPASGDGIDVSLEDVNISVDMVQYDPSNSEIQVVIGQTLKGDDGKSAYEIWLDEGHTGTEEDFLEWLRAYDAQSDWNQNDSTKVDYIKNKPTIVAQVNSDWNATGGVAQILNKPQMPTVNDASLTIRRNGTDVQVFSANQSSNVIADVIVPTKTSDLTNDSDFVVDANYVHTDNNYTSSEKSKLAGIQDGAEVNVQANWNVSDSSSDAYIRNKPVIPTQTSQLTNNSGFITAADLSGYQTVQNMDKKGSGNPWPSSPNDSHYPSTKLVDNIFEKKLASQIAYTEMGTATKVPQITTNTKGQVIGISEVNIAYPSGTGSVTGSTTAFVKEVSLSGNTLSGQIQEADLSIGNSSSGIPTSQAVIQYVNSSVSSMAANYVTKNASGDAFETNAELVGASTYYSGGVVISPTKNDYAIVLKDETKADEIPGYSAFTDDDDYIGFYILSGTSYVLVTSSNVSSLSIVPGTTKAYRLPSARYINTSATSTPSWSFQYLINDSGLTAAQIAAMNSGINTTKVANYDSHIGDSTIHVTSQDKTNWNGKLDPVTAVTHDSTKNYVIQVTQASGGQVSIIEGVLDYDNLINKPTIPDVSIKADKVTGATSGNLAGLDQNGNLTDSGVPKGILDKMPSSLGNAGQAIIVSQGASGLEFGSVSSTLLGLTDTTIISPTSGQVLTYDQANYVWKNQNLPVQQNADWNSSSGVTQILNKPTIPSAPGTLNTTATTAQTTVSSEPLSGSVVLHKIAKTGAYSDLIGKPTIPDITIKADKVSGATSGDFAGLDASGNLTDSGYKANDFVYTEGNGIDVSDSNVISVIINQGNANGLSVSPSGVAISTVVASVNGSGGTNGAMLATDKEKLDGISTDSNLVHKTGNETVAGEKTFTDDVTAKDAALVLDSNTSSNHRITIETDTDTSGNNYGILSFNDSDETDNVILRGVLNPLESGDAANKNYVDGILSGYGYGVVSSKSQGTYNVTLSGYELAKGFVSVKFTSDVTAGAMLSINSKTAKAIRYMGSSVTTGLIKNSDIATFYYDGTYYNVVSAYSANELPNFSFGLYDTFYADATEVYTDSSTNKGYMLLYGTNSSLGGGIYNGTTMMVDFSATGGSVEDLVTAGMTDFQFRFDDSQGTLYHVEILNDNLQMSSLHGVKRIAFAYVSSDGCFNVVSVEHYTTSQITQNSNALVTSGAVYDAIGDIESALDIIINGQSQSRV